jgi:LemA protein
MNNSTLLWVGIAILLGMVGCSKYNGMVDSDQNVKGKWGNVQNQYQRRSDLIGNLVDVVKAASNFEKGTLESVIQARASATQMKVDASNLTPEQIEKFNQSQGGLTQALGKLMQVVEAYPDLKSGQQFRDLSAEIAGTENRCATARKDFNDAVQSYNTKVKKFPTNLFAGVFGFREQPFVVASQAAQEAPKLGTGKF